MRIVGVIPIKLNNERVPNKNIKLFYDGTPLMQFVQKNLLAIDDIDEIYCYCSDQCVEKYLLNGVKFLKRPTDLDYAKTTSNEILKCLAKEIEADIYVYAMATAPFLTPRHISEGIQMVASREYDSAMPVTAMHDYLWKNNKPLNFDVRNVPRSQDLETIYCETCGVFIINRDVILDGGRRIGDHPYLIEVNSIEAIDIDYPEDFLIANAVYRALNLKENGDLS